MNNTKNKWGSAPFLVGEELRAAIVNASEAHPATLAIRMESDTDIYVDDFSDGRYINYHLVEPTSEWLKERLFWGSDCREYQSCWKDIVLDVLSKIDPNMFICLNKICFVNSEADIQEMLKVVNAEEWELPDSLDMEDCSAVGMCWGSRSCVVVNLHAIEQANTELAQETATVTDFWDEHAGILVTLLHSIRCLGLMNPMMRESNPNTEGLEDEAEHWARAVYEVLFGD